MASPTNPVEILHCEAGHYWCRINQQFIRPNWGNKRLRWCPEHRRTGKAASVSAARAGVSVVKEFGVPDKRPCARCGVPKWTATEFSWRWRVLADGSRVHEPYPRCKTCEAGRAAAVRQRLGKAEMARRDARYRQNRRAKPRVVRTYSGGPLTDWFATFMHTHGGETVRIDVEGGSGGAGGAGLAPAPSYTLIPAYNDARVAQLAGDPWTQDRVRQLRNGKLCRQRLTLPEIDALMTGLGRGLELSTIYGSEDLDNEARAC